MEEVKDGEAETKQMEPMNKQNIRGDEICVNEAAEKNQEILIINEWEKEYM